MKDPNPPSPVLRECRGRCPHRPGLLAIPKSSYGYGLGILVPYLIYERGAMWALPPTNCPRNPTLAEISGSFQQSQSSPLTKAHPELREVNTLALW
jgi:hypothetical protein